MPPRRKTIARCTCHSRRNQQWLLKTLRTLGFAHWVETLRKEGSTPSCNSISLVKHLDKSPAQYTLQLGLELSKHGTSVPTPTTMTSPEKKLVIALRPQFADAILDGSKVWELRRQCPVQLHSGMTVLLYCEGKLLGEVTCDHWDLSGSADDIARRHWRGSALRYEEAQAYLEDARRPGALHLTSPRRYTKPQPWQGAPVQNFLYL